MRAGIGLHRGMEKIAEIANIMYIPCGRWDYAAGMFNKAVTVLGKAG